MHEKKNSSKPLIVYYIIALVVVMLLNTLLFPQISRYSVKEVTYSEFLTMLDEGKIKEVEVGDQQIAFTPIEQDEEKKIYYTTNRVTADEKIVERLIDADVTFSQVVPEEMSPILSFLMSWVLPLVIFYGFGTLMFRRMSKQMGGNSMSFGKSNAKVYVEAQTGKTFDDVAGEDEAKDALKEIVDFLHDPQKYRDIGAKLPKGALLVGPPGTGKTLLAKAVAGEAKVPFFSISGSEFVEMFVGMGAARVRDLFKQAGEKAPCIVFIDEIDAIGKRRDQGGLGGNDEREQTLNQLLTEMDGFDAGKGVVILAATNRPEILDKALLRPGRFDRRIPVELPDLAGREAILRVHAREVKTEPNIDYTQIARSTSGCSGAELANIINEAAIAAVKAGRKMVAQRDMEEAIETVIAGYQRKNAVVSPRDKLTVSYHEIGHALVAAKLENAAPVQKITIIPRTSGALGYTMQVDEEERLLMTREQILDKITTYCGGRAAEALVFGRITSGASNDIEQATKLARAMITRLGMSETFGMMALETQSGSYLTGDAALVCSDQTAARIDVEIKNTIAACYERATQILTDNKDKLHELAKVLLDKETITGIEFMAILAPNQLPSSFEDEKPAEAGQEAPAQETDEPAQSGEGDDVQVTGDGV